MNLDIFSYQDLQIINQNTISKQIEAALLKKGILGIRGVPDFEKTTRDFIATARQFSFLDEKVKKQYAPDRDSGDTEGYELGAEWFKDQDGNWQIDDKKASYYAYVPDRSCNKWPREIDLKTSYQALADVIFKTAKLLFNVIGLNEKMGLRLDELVGYGRMLHYQKIADTHQRTDNWCGAHYDHGLFTGLVPAYYFQDGEEILEPPEAGLYIKPSDTDHFQKMDASDKSILLFQVGEFAQLMMDDRIFATQHLVKKAKKNIERFTFALFFNPPQETMIQSSSLLTKDLRYVDNQFVNGSITYEKWAAASYARYRAS